jgi:hypothetical protein
VKTRIISVNEDQNYVMISILQRLLLASDIFSCR